MITFNSLPDLVQLRILEYAIVSSSSPSNKLAIAAVCHEWRVIAVPLVFKRVVVEATSARRDFYIFDETPFWISTSGQNFAPCLALIALAGTSSYVKVIELDLEDMRGTRDLADRFEEIFFTGTAVWSSVSILQINIRYAASARGPQFVPNKLVDSLARYMPNIQSISFTPKSYNSGNSIFSGRLVERYSDQLKVLRGPTLSATVVPKLGGAIVSLDLAIDNTSEVLLPQISAAGLKMLSLRSVPHTFSWKYFTLKEQDTAVWFGNLESLKLEFLEQAPATNGHRTDVNDGSTIGTQSFQVSFPMLQIINAGIWPKREFNLFGNAQLSRNLKSIVGRDSIDMLAQLLPTLHVSALRHIHIIVLSNTGQLQFYQVTNRIFNTDTHYAYANMYIKELGFALSAEMVCWQALTMLSLESMHFATIVDLIPRLTRLTYMEVNLVDFAPIVSSSQQFDPLEYLKTTATVLSTSIDSLVTWKLENTDLHHMAIKCVMHLIHRLPALQEFRTSDLKLEKSYKLSQKPQSPIANMRSKFRLLF